MLKSYIQDLADKAFSARADSFVDNVTQRVLSRVQEKVSYIADTASQLHRSTLERYNELLDQARKDAKDKIEQAYRDGIKDGYGLGYSDGKSNEVKTS